ncbi:MAG: hypothetical protein HXX18_06140 [Bacteroidetes bacterium]|nr:hypothetical protein [Bacteroidota bacterium]
MKITITDEINGFLSFDLRDILRLINNVEGYRWFLSEINFNYIEPKTNISEISQEDYLFCEEAISMINYEIKYNDLNRIANGNIQIIDGTIKGKNEMNEIIISIFDSSYWVINTTNNNLINNIKKRFSEIKIIE